MGPGAPLGNISATSNCVGFFCYPARELSTTVSTPGCDPNVATCGTVRATVTVELKGTSQNRAIFPGKWSTADWKLGADVVGQCGKGTADITQDLLDTWIEIGAFSCAPGSPAPPNSGLYTLVVNTCNSTSCPKSLSIPVDLQPPALDAALCVHPPPSGCGDQSCGSCPGGGGGGGQTPGSPGAPGKGPAGSGGAGVSVGGGGAFLAPPGSGPGARLRYLAGGVGGSGFPGTTGHRIALGRYWIHELAERIVEAPDASHVWLLTRYGTFRELTDSEPDGVYDVVAPSDEYRTLTKTVTGWELTDLAGTVQEFRSDGLWIATRDRNGNASTASYSGTTLASVAFADGRSELFAYHPAGKLASITEVGVGVTDCVLQPEGCRTWSYTWTGDDLDRIDRPDGSAIEFLYGVPSLPGYMTRMTLVGTDAVSERIEGAWEYDAEGNAFRAWKGAASFADPAAVDKWELAFDDPADPTETTVTDPLGVVSVYTFDRDPVSSKPRLTAISGDCPVCGLGPNTQLTYGDAANPLRPTQEIDGSGTVTVMSYDLNGQIASRIEAFGTPFERETTWDYDASFPAFVTAVVRPSVSGNPFDERRTAAAYDAEGNAIRRTISGVENGATFILTTEMIYNAAGRPTSIDPPGFGTADETSFTYDPARGDVVALTRTDPVVGTASFAYDAFNRRTSATDPNGAETVTAYDALDRVTRITQAGAVPAEDLVTERQYDVFGNLFRTILPRGNVLEYGYDAAGRLMSIERKPDATTPGERTFYTLDAFGHYTKEELQRWNGSAWVTESSTDFVYTTRCHLDQVIHADGSVTEYDYDCDGNVVREWDANHPSAGKTAPATRVYTYNDLGHLRTLVEPWGGAGGGDAVTVYAFDVQDHLTSVGDAEGNLTTYTYSDRDLMTRESSPVSGVTTHTYDEHGSLVTTTDARSVTVTRTNDAADRLTFVDYPDPALDTTYTYDDPGVAFSLGRLTAITRGGASVDYAYDLFGRVTRDGELLYFYDKNGNRVSVEYPGAVRAMYNFDFADRESSLTVDDGSGLQPVVTSASYLPSGPLTALALGNGVTESRLFDARYFPDSIAVTTPRLHFWDYTTDGVGNVTSIVETEDCVPMLTLANRTLIGEETFASCDDLAAGPDVIVAAGAEVTFRAGGGISLGTGWSVELGAIFSAVTGSSSPKVSSFTYGYQDVQYFLTAADGPPWGSLAWTYDRIGNRLTEDRNGSVDPYSYVTSRSGNTAILAQAGSRTYTTGPAGHVTSITDGADQIDLPIDDDGRLAGFERPLATAEAAFAYDGRSLLRRSEELLSGGPDVGFTEPTYSSEGLLHALRRQPSPTDPEERVSIFYLADRPVAQLRQETGGASTWHFLSTEHLGAPMLATDLAGGEVWHGPFEPFGTDFFAGSSESALTKGVFLRYPGQWDDSTWSDGLSGELYTNVYRWLQGSTGRYTRADPASVPDRLFIDEGLEHLYAYADSRPTLLIDPLGLIALAPGVKCKNFDGVVEQLTLLSQKPCCAGFFTALGADLPTLIADAPPYLKLIPPPVSGNMKPVTGRFNCEKDPDSVRIIKPLCKGPGRRGRRLEKATIWVLHELGHYADCNYNGNKLTGEDGQSAEIACFGAVLSGDVD